MLGVCNYRTMEAKARQIISQHCPDCVCGQKAVPIERLAEKGYGLEIEYQNLTKHGERILGKLICNDGLTTYYDTELGKYAFMMVNAGTILVEARLMENGQNGRYRFTVAHELAHWILHKEMIAQSGHEAAFDESISDVKMEQQADYLASAILMPLGSVKRYFHSLFGKYSGDALICEMAGYFGVSKQAMQIRLKSHNLI